MTLTSLSFNGQKHYYLLVNDDLKLPIWTLAQTSQTRRLEQQASSLFWHHPASSSLCKLVTDKYPRWSLRWFCRDLLGKRLIGHIDAFREYRSNRLIRQAGLNVVPCKAAGLALNPLNPLASFLAVQYLQDHQSGEAYFRQADEAGRLALLRALARDVLALARQGYHHRDLHLGNLMLAPSGAIVWIDTHVRRLPLLQTQRKQALIASLESHKLFGLRYHYYLLSQLALLHHAQ
ncbi:lipopolysaccharide kinase InaA family protein [Aeromonas tecta]|uniref:lipopolysaccharide kinase InaA family protein n=1 Tax=Aeromonas tecta TaxID=324617 RepID=UPI000681D493|nr:lipopolysaccharide kinase InaA family protein [Aeromonas tecta]